MTARSTTITKPIRTLDTWRVLGDCHRLIGMSDDRAPGTVVTSALLSFVWDAARRTGRAETQNTIYVLGAPHESYEPARRGSEPSAADATHPVMGPRPARISAALRPSPFAV
jgi:hypothetical protein